MEAKTLPADACVFGRFGQLSPASVHSVDCWFDWSEVVDLCFLHCHVFTQKLLFVELNQLQTTLWIVDALVFLIDCEQTLYPLWTQLTHWHMFMQNGEHTAFWYLQLLCYLTQLQFTIGQTEFVGFFGVSRDNYRIWVTCAFSIICVCRTALKVSITPLNCYFLRSRVRITLIKTLFCLNRIFPIRKQCFINTWNSDFSIVLKICNSKVSKVGDGHPQAPFSKTTTPRCRGERYSIPWIAPHNPWFLPYNAECETKLHQVLFLSLWYDTVTIPLRPPYLSTSSKQFCLGRWFI